jgi:DNA topoisomerase-3
MEQSRGIRQAPEVITKVKKTKSVLADISCPKCKSGTVLKGKENLGCSNYKKGCDFRLPLIHMKKKISDSQFKKILSKGKSDALKGFVSDEGKLDGWLRLNEEFNLVFENSEKPLVCPKCKKGEVLKGKSAFGCSEYQNSCDFIMPFDKIKSLAAGKKLNKELVRKLISNYT